MDDKKTAPDLIEQLETALAEAGPDDEVVVLDSCTGVPPMTAERAQSIFDELRDEVAKAAKAKAADIPKGKGGERKLPLPGRNKPCICGKKRKFKHCCLPKLKARQRRK